MMICFLSPFEENPFDPIVWQIIGPSTFASSDDENSGEVGQIIAPSRPFSNSYLRLRWQIIVLSTFANGDDKE